MNMKTKASLSVGIQWRNLPSVGRFILANGNNVFSWIGWLAVLVLTALWDSISVYIGQSPREREKEKRKYSREKSPNNPHPHPLQA